MHTHITYYFLLLHYLLAQIYISFEPGNKPVRLILGIME